MSHRSKIHFLLTVAVIAGLSASSAIAADYPPTTETPVTIIPKDFKPSAPIKIFTTPFTNTVETIKVNQPTRPTMTGFAKNAKVTETIKLPNGKIVKEPPLKTDKFGHVVLTETYFKKAGIYTIFVTVGKKIERITFEVGVSKKKGVVHAGKKKGKK